MVTDRYGASDKGDLCVTRFTKKHTYLHWGQVLPSAFQVVNATFVHRTPSRPVR